MQHVQSGRAQQPGRQSRPTQLYSAESPGYNTDYEQLRAGGRHRRIDRTCTDGFLPEAARRSGAGRPELRIHARLQPRAHRSVHGRRSGATRARPSPATRDTGATSFPLVPAGETWPLLFARQQSAGDSPSFQRTPAIPDSRGDEHRHGDLRRRTSRSAIRIPGRLDCSARCRRTPPSSSATSATATSSRGTRKTGTT